MIWNLIDFYRLNFRGSSPWNIAKISSDNQKYDYIDISPCALFKQSSYNDYFVPEVCKSSHICHNITSIPATKNSPAHTESIGKLKS